MSDATPDQPKLQTFYVYAPDKKEEGILDKRLSVRSQHLERISSLIASKAIRFGGVLLDPEAKPTEADPRPRLSGSTLVIEAESIEKVKEIITTDVYYESGVWDREKLVICPIIVATPLA